MKCPICNMDLLLSEKLGIEIDYCPKCRGIWLDRGELDKIMEKSQPVSPREYADRHDEHGGYDHHGYKEHRKKSFFEELFD
jgi:uncharacterized protein